MLEVKDAVGGFSFVVSSVGVLLDRDMLVVGLKRNAGVKFGSLRTEKLASKICMLWTRGSCTDNSITRYRDLSA